MRAQSRSPPFLVIGLLVALVILGANYWNLSSNNSKLAFEVAELQDQVRQISAKRISAEKKIDSMAESYNRNKDTLAQKESDVKSLNSQIEDKVGELQNLGKEKESCQNNLKNCEDNSNGIQQELLKVKEENEQLKRKEQEEMSNTQKCDSVCADMRKMIIDAVEKTMGINAVQTLHQAGVDVGEYKDKFGSQNQAQAEQQQQPQQQQPQQQQPQQNVGGERDAAAKPQEGENVGAGQGVANAQQPGESNALPQGQINPQAGQGQDQANVIPAAQVQGQIPPENKPQAGEQADVANPIPNINPAVNDANIIPPGQSNPEIPNPQVNQQVLPPGNPPQDQGNPPQDQNNLPVPGNQGNNPAVDTDDQVLKPGQVKPTTAKPVNAAIQDIANTLRQKGLDSIANKSSLLGFGNLHNTLGEKAGEIAKQTLQGSFDKLKNSIMGKTVGPKISSQNIAEKNTLGQGQRDLNPREAGKEEVSSEVKPIQTTGKVIQSKLEDTKSKVIAQPLQGTAGLQTVKEKDDYDDDYEEEEGKKTVGKGDGKKLEGDYDEEGEDEKLKFIPGMEKAGDVKAADDSIDTLEQKMKSQDQQK